MSKFKITLSSGDVLNISAPDNISDEELLKLANEQLRKGETITGIDEQEYVDTNKSMQAAIEKNKKAVSLGDDTWYQRAQKDDGTFGLETEIIPNESKFEAIKRGIAETIFPANYEARIQGEEPGLKEGTLDAALMPLNFIPGFGAAKAGAKTLPIIGKALTPTQANIAKNVVGELGRGVAAEAITSEAQDRDYNVLLAGAGALPGLAGVIPYAKRQGELIESLGEKIIPEVDKFIAKEGIFNEQGLKRSINNTLKNEFKDIDLRKVNQSELANKLLIEISNRLDNAGQTGKIVSREIPKYKLAVSEAILQSLEGMKGQGKITDEYLKNIPSIKGLQVPNGAGYTIEQMQEVAGYIPGSAKDAYRSLLGAGSQSPLIKQLTEISERELKKTNASILPKLYGSLKSTPGIIGTYTPSIGGNYILPKIQQEQDK